MPPALSDDEMSDASGVGAVTTPPSTRRDKKIGSYADVVSDDGNEGSSSDSGKGKKRENGRSRGAAQSNGASSAARKKKEAPKEEPEEEDEDDDDDEGEEDEYEVKEIAGHVIDDGGNPRFHVIWKGYEDPSDYTWEPQENLAENASEILSEYIRKIGGEKKLYEKPAKGKKRGQSSASASASGAAAKRSRKNDHPSDRESPAVDVPRVFKPPAGSWEDDVTDVEMFRGDDGDLRVFLTWKNGSKSQHAAQLAYLRCPQRILRFYESRISFKMPSE